MRLKATVKKVIFQKNDFFILEVIDSKKISFKVKGNIFSDHVLPGLTLDMECTPTQSQYGTTYAISSYSEVDPTDIEGIHKYFQHRGYDSFVSNQIIQVLGEDCLDKLKKDPNLIYQVEGILEKDRASLLGILQREIHVMELTVIMLAMGLGAVVASKMYNRYGAEAKSTFLKNPYCVIETGGVKFTKADEVAIQMGIDPGVLVRTKAIILHVLNDVIDKEGHVCTPYKRLPSLCQEFTRVGSDQIDKAIEELRVEGKVILDRDFIYGKRAFTYESESANRLKSYIQEDPINFDLDAFLRDYPYTPGIPFFEEDQIEVLRSVLKNRCMVITGMPGTGKTTITRAIVSMFNKMGKSIVMMAPMGISAKQMRRATQMPASTIHRGMMGSPNDIIMEDDEVNGSSYEVSQWTYCKKNPKFGHVFIVDEFSTVGQDIFYHLMQGMDPKARFIMIGDPNQLPSVSAGSVLKDLIDSGAIPVVTLKVIKRQGVLSNIIVNCHRILAGDDILVTEDKSDFSFLPYSDEESLLLDIRKLTKTLQDKGKDHIVLSPRYKGVLGVTNINKWIRDDLNPGPRTRINKDLDFGVNDRVMILKNDRKRKVSNGDIGTITRIVESTKEIYVLVDDSPDPVTYPFYEAVTTITLAYCITCHKAQGASWDYVILPVVPSFDIQLQRNLLFSATSRAKTKLYMMGSRVSVRKAIANDKISHRYTLLATRLKDTPSGF